MKDTLASPTPARSSDGEDFGNRKLIRPSLNRSEPIGGSDRRERAERAPRPSRSPVAVPAGKKTPPPEQTHAESFYYQKQMQSHTPMVMVLHDGETIHGTIEWYDKYCLKVIRTDGHPNLLVYKGAIKYLYKESEHR